MNAVQITEDVSMNVSTLLALISVHVKVGIL